MKNIKMKYKLLSLTLLTGLIPILIIGILTLVIANNEFEDEILKTNTVF